MMSTADRPWPQDAKYLQIGDVCLDLRYRHVLRDGESIELQQRIFDLLLLFIAEPHALHTRAELFERLWPKLIVDDANLSQNVWLLRKALGESRKQWVRTVAKGGYVFESPGPVTWSNERPAAAFPATTAPAHVPTTPVPTLAEASATAQAAGVATAGRPAESASQETPASDHGLHPSPAIEAASAAPPPRGSFAQNFGRRGWPRWAAATLLLATVAVGLVLWRSAADRPTPDKPLAVALIPLQDSADTLRWPAKLLQDWLGWKLGSLPEVNLLSEADLAAATARQSPVVVFLTSGQAPDGQVAVRARLRGRGEEQCLEEIGPPAQVPAMVDRLSQRIIERLDPPRATPWPTLDITVPAAQRYVQAVEAADRRDWMAVSAIGADVARQAPRFGPVRLHLARAQSRLSQAASAKEQMEIARGLLRPLPDDVKTLLDAQSLAIDPERAVDAAKAFGMIAARYPAKPAYRLEHARLLIAAGEPKLASSLLQANLMQRSPVGLRIARHLISASAAAAMGDPDLMRLHARAAENLARIAGRGWELERAEALLAIGRADQSQFPERKDTRLFVEAARLFEQAGNATGALHAQFRAETVAPPVSGPNPRLDTLLAKARAGGYRKLEIDILMSFALQHERAGDRGRYRDWLQQAWAVAQDAGDIAARNRMDVALATSDLFELHLSDMDARLARLKRADPEGNVGRMTFGLLSFMNQLRGDMPAALEAASKSVGKLPAWSPGQPVPQPVALAACDRVDLRLFAGDLTGARKNLGLCDEVKGLLDKKRALRTTAIVEWAAGNRTEAERAIAQARALPSTLGGLESWVTKLELAESLTMLGQAAESERLVEEVKSELPSQSFALLHCLAALRQAQNAVAKGDWAAAKRHSEEARRLLPRDAWTYRSELDIADSVLALANGDRVRAIALASAVHRQARERGHVFMELELHSLFPPGTMTHDCSAAQRQGLVARTGMRGVLLDWLTRGLRQETHMRGSDVPRRGAADTEMSPPPQSAER